MVSLAINIAAFLFLAWFFFQIASVVWFGLRLAGKFVVQQPGDAFGMLMGFAWIGFIATMGFLLFVSPLLAR